VRSIFCCGVVLFGAFAASAAKGQSATLILVNGRIWTENPQQREAEAIAIEGHRIIAVSSSTAIRKLAAPGCQIIDLAGRRVVPGFNDAHVHLLGGGDALASVQLRDAASAGEFRRRIGAYARSLPKGAWIRNGNWDHKQWTPPVLPTRQLIDAVTPDNPVFVWRLDGHMALANGLAMKLAGLDRSTRDVPGGEIERDKDGNPTGILKDHATSLVERVMPPPSERELDAALKGALQEAASHGVTSVQNMWDSTSDPYSALKLRTFQKFARSEMLTVRIYHAHPLHDWKSLADTGVQAPFGSPLLRIGNLKSFADGALGSETAWMEAPFADRPGYSGLASADLTDSASYYASIQGADKAGLQISIHAIGDRAIHTVLDLFERAERENGPADRRFRIEHVQHVRPDDAPRFAQLGVVASMQPYHAIDDGRWAEKQLGPVRIESSYAWRLLLDHGAVLAFGSDWPVAPLDPLIGIYAAATRRTLDAKNPQGWVPQQRITVAEAVHAYTVGAAFAEHQEQVKGSLEPGKLADLVVLTDDIFRIPTGDLDKVRVYMTVFDGTVIYQQSPGVRAGEGSRNLDL
jgi:predicted amidohydrolase YtcJ